MTKRVEIVICERNRLFREGIVSILRKANYRILASVVEMGEVKSRGFGTDNNIVFLIGGKSSVETIGSTEIIDLSTKYPNAHIILLLDTCSSNQRWQAEQAGVSGVLLKSISGEVLVRSIELVLLGEHVFSVPPPPISSREGIWPGAGSEGNAETAEHSLKNGKQVLSISSDEARTDTENSFGDERHGLATRRGQLSQREMDILKCLVDGDSNKVIARRCNIAESTVKVHLKAILRKIDCGNRTQAAVWALNQMKAGDAEPCEPPAVRSPGDGHQEFRHDRTQILEAPRQYLV